MLLKYLLQQLDPLENNRPYYIAYSGGLDSHVLLHAMAQLRYQFPGLSLHAIHVHHGLSPNADSWADHCRRVAMALNIDFRCEYVQKSPAPGDSIEAWAREVRYAVFARHLLPNSILLTAHTQDDQAETLLLQLLRGAGPKGLSAMPRRQVFSSSYLLRPLLNLTRQQLQEYAVQYQLTWIEDDSNINPRFDRNFLRHQVMPVLRQRWPAAGRNIARSAGHCAEAAAGLAELAHHDLAAYASAPALPIAALSGLSPSRQRNALRYWLSNLGCRLPNTRHMQQIQQDLINGRLDSRPQVNWGSWAIRRSQQSLIVTPVVTQLALPQEISWDLSMPLQLPGGLGELRAIKQIGGLTLSIDPANLKIRFRHGGERCRPEGRAHSTTLKKLFQEWRVPVWQRSTIPLLYYQDELAAVIGHCVCTPFAAPAGQMGWAIFLNV